VDSDKKMKIAIPQKNIATNTPAITAPTPRIVYNAEGDSFRNIMIIPVKPAINAPQGKDKGRINILKKTGE
jgi:hypothetical protein